MNEEEINSEELECQFISYDFNLPNHKKELLQATDLIDKLRHAITVMKINSDITGELHTTFFDKIVKVLQYVGDLSIPAQKTYDILEEMYTLRYSHAPELGKKLWVSHYRMFNQPYNVLKNRCYKLLDDLDDIYKIKYEIDPPNWNHQSSIFFTK